MGGTVIILMEFRGLEGLGGFRREEWSSGVLIPAAVTSKPACDGRESRVRWGFCGEPLSAEASREVVMSVGNCVRCWRRKLGTTDRIYGIN
jgi:hypothetical protein